MPERPPRIARFYRFAMAVNRPIISWWGRLEVQGRELLAATGPILLAGNHDSHWDPVAIGVAAMPRRQICALAKASMWKNPVLARILDGMGQIPIERGTGDGQAMVAATTALREGTCIGIFPEGTLSQGKVLRARSGIGRLARDVPEAQIICCSVSGTVDIVRFPRRPRIRVVFSLPEGGGLQGDERPVAFAERLLAQARERAPRIAAGRRRAE